MTAPLTPLLLIASLFEVAAAAGLKTPIHRERVLKLVRSTRIAPGWLIANKYVFQLDLERALAQWADETSDQFS